MSLSTDIVREIKSIKDITYTNNLKIGNITVSPNIGNVVATAYLGSIPLTTSQSSSNHLYLQIDKMYLPQNDSTGSNVFINGNSVTTGSVIDNQQIGISYSFSTSATHNVILLHGSVRGAWIYTDNGNIPVYDRLSNNLSLNINETTDNKLYIGFTSNDSLSNQTITYTGSAGTFKLSGYSDQFIIYENDKDVRSSRNKMSFTLKMFCEKSKTSSGGGSTGGSDGYIRMFCGSNLTVTFCFTSELTGTVIELQSVTKTYDYFPNKASCLQLYYLSDDAYKLTAIKIASFTINNGYSSATQTYKWSLKVGAPPTSISEPSIAIGGFSFTPNGQYGMYTVPAQTIYIYNSPVIYRTTDIYIY